MPLDVPLLLACGGVPKTKVFDLIFFDIAVWRLALSPDGKTLAYSGQESVHLWDMATGRENGKLPGHHWSLTFSPDAKTLAGGIDFNTVNIWNMADRRVVRRLEI